MSRIAFLLALLLATSSTFAADPFEIVTFRDLGRISQKAYDDLDGDGKREILLMDGHRAVIYRPKDGGGYDLAAPWEIVLDRNALYFDVSQVDTDGRTREIVLVTPQGVVYHAIRDGVLSPTATPLIRSPNLVTRGQEDDVHWRGFLQDLDGDGLADVVLPTREGFALFYQGRSPAEEGAPGGPGRWPTERQGLVPYHVRSSMSAGRAGLTGVLHGTLSVPDFRIRDFTRDGRNDFAVDNETSLRIHAAAVGNRIEAEPSVEIDLTALTGTGKGMPQIRIHDLNGDNAPDFLVTRRWEGITDIFLGGAPLTKPALTIRLDGWAFDPRVIDLNADGRPDLIIPMTARVGPVAAVRVVATGAISVENYVFLNTGDAALPFPPKPDHRRVLPVNIRLFVDGTGQIRTTHSLLVELGGDFTGDGRKELVHYQGGNRLAFYAGTVDGLFQEDPYLRLRIPDTDGVSRMESAVLDLNGDGRTDLALYYMSENRKADRVVLLISRSRKK